MVEKADVLKAIVSFIFGVDGSARRLTTTPGLPSPSVTTFSEGRVPCDDTRGGVRVRRSFVI